jgi:hypothetical protein
MDQGYPTITGARSAQKRCQLSNLVVSLEKVVTHRPGLREQLITSIDDLRHRPPQRASRVRSEPDAK